MQIYKLFFCENCEKLRKMINSRYCIELYGKAYILKDNACIFIIKIVLKTSILKQKQKLIYCELIINKICELNTHNNNNSFWTKIVLLMYAITNV